MIKNQKGMTGLEIGLVIGLLFFLVPVLKPFIPGFGSDGQKTSQVQSTVKTIKPAADSNGNPVYVKDSKGNISPLMEVAESTNSQNSQVNPPKPLGERIALWFVHLGFLGLALALIFPAGFFWVISFIKGRFKALRDEAANHKEDLADLKTEAKRIVVSVERGLSLITDPILRDKVLTEMSKGQDGSTKALVTELKGV